VLTMGVDTQPDRLECEIKAWGPGMENWVIDYVVLEGDPQDPPSRPGSVWQRLDLLRRTPIWHMYGVPIYISAYGIDSGGHNTQDVYNYGGGRERMGCVIVKGASRPGKPIIASAPSKVDVDWKGQKTEEGAKLWMVGTDTGKEWMWGRMKLTSGPGAMHAHPDLGDVWFKGMTAERPLRKMDKRGRVLTTWIKPPGERNEPWDCANYNLAIAHKLGLHKWTDKDWQHLRAKLIPAAITLDLFAAAPGSSEPAPVPVLEPAPAPTATPASEPVAAEVIETPQADLEHTRPLVQAEPVMTNPVPAEPVPEALAAVPAMNAPLYPINPMPLRRRRMRSRGI